MLTGICFVIGGLALAVLDQLIKIWATTYLLPVGNMPLIPGFIELQYVLNDGMAFSLLSGRRWLLIAVTGAGLLVVAKDDATHQGLSEQMAVHDIHRVYHAVVYGNLKEDSGTVDAPIGRDPRDRKKMAVTATNSKPARTHWQVLERFGNFTYIACRLETGRTHQIRVHMSHIGHPLAGDPVYGPRNVLRFLNGQCLHAKELGFRHPITGDMLRFDSELPPYFQEYLTRLRKEHRR